MKILVCGGRKFSSKAFLYRVLDKLNVDREAIECVVQGGCSGADILARDWAKDRGVICKEYRADWNRHGNSAGYKRNWQMILDNPDISLIVAFPGGVGTGLMVSIGKKQGIEILDARKMEGDWGGKTKEEFRWLE